MDRNDLIGERIKKRRVEKGYTQKTLAQAMTDICNGGVHEKSIAAWENGEGCKTRYIPDLCEVLDCDTEYIFGYSPTPHKETASTMEVTGLSQNAVDALINNKRITIDPKENDRTIAINSLLESETGMRFLSELYYYIFGNYQWVNLFGEHPGDSPIQHHNFGFELFETGTSCHEQYGSREFVEMLRNSKMAKMQELLSDVRKEINEE